MEQCFYVWISILFVDRHSPTKEVRKKIASKSSEKAPRGYTQCVLTGNTDCEQNLFHKKTPQSTFKLCIFFNEEEGVDADF